MEIFEFLKSQADVAKPRTNPERSGLVRGKLKNLKTESSIRGCGGTGIHVCFRSIWLYGLESSNLSIPTASKLKTKTQKANLKIINQNFKK